MAPNLHILVSSYTVPCIPNLKEIAPAVRRIFFVPNNKSVRKLMKFGAQVALPKPYISTKLGTIIDSIFSGTENILSMVRFAVKLRKI